MPCLFSATHWYIPESDRFNAAMERAPFSIWTRPCGGRRKSSAYPLQGQCGLLCLKSTAAIIGAPWREEDSRREEREGGRGGEGEIAERALWRSMYVRRVIREQMRRQWWKLLTCIFDIQKWSNVDNSTSGTLKSHLSSGVASCKNYNDSSDDDLEWILTQQSSLRSSSLQGMWCLTLIRGAYGRLLISQIEHISEEQRHCATGTPHTGWICSMFLHFCTVPLWLLK